jgi:hypothetical protein
MLYHLALPPAAADGGFLMGLRVEVGTVVMAFQPQVVLLLLALPMRQMQFHCSILTTSSFTQRPHHHHTCYVCVPQLSPQVICCIIQHMVLHL